MEYLIDENTEEVVMNTERLDDESVVVNFDVYDSENNQIVAQAGYVRTRQDFEDRCFYVTVFNAEGDVLSETVVPMQFNQC